jgi:anti-sigma factor RsiW
VADPRPPANQDGSIDHAAHDPELIVIMLDRDISTADRAAGEALVAACDACATLHEDLVALAVATSTAPAPARPRDFALTREVAASLRRPATREPLPATTRLSGDMRSTRSRHETHDRLLVANLIDRSVDEAERSRAEELLAACRECEQLYDDLVALSAATRAMTVPARPRDFTLTAADAERLRVRGWRRLLGAIGSSRDAFSRPLAVGLTTLGLAGLMVATVPSFFMGGAASGPGLSTAGQAVGDTAVGALPPEAISMAPEAPAASGGFGAAGAAPEAMPQASGETGIDPYADDRLFVGSEISPIPGEPDGRDGNALTSTSEGPITRTTTIVVAGTLVLIGLLLFGLRWTARRLGDG